jgi:hypothetical protein
LKTGGIREGKFDALLRGITPTYEFHSPGHDVLRPECQDSDRVLEWFENPLSTHLYRGKKRS